MSSPPRLFLTIGISFGAGMLVGFLYYSQDSVIPAVQNIYKPFKSDFIKTEASRISAGIFSEPEKKLPVSEPEKTLPIKNITQQQDESLAKPTITFHDYKFHRAHLPRTLTFTSIQTQRRETLQKFCQGKQGKLDQNSLPQFSARLDYRHLLVNDKSGVLFCVLPKVASTNWKRTFLGIDEKHKNKNLATISGSNIHRMMAGPNLNDRKLRTKTILKDFYKFMFVRHPFERLASCYRDKFVNFDKTGKESPYYMLTYGSQILGLYRKGLSMAEIKRGFGVTFSEFARWLIEKRVKNEHWDPMFDICHPCLINYDFIGDMSSLRKDAGEALSHIGLTDASNFEHKMSQTVIQGFKISSRDLAKQLFAELDNKLVNDLYNMYKNDFLAFGFSKDL